MNADPCQEAGPRCASRYNGTDWERKAEHTRPVVGAIDHFDLTVDDAPGIRDFHAAVVGWKLETMPVDDYEDDVLKSPTASEWLGGKVLHEARYHEERAG